MAVRCFALPRAATISVHRISVSPFLFFGLLTPWLLFFFSVNFRPCSLRWLSLCYRRLESLRSFESSVIFCLQQWARYARFAGARFASVGGTHFACLLAWAFPRSTRTRGLIAPWTISVFIFQEGHHCKLSLLASVTALRFFFSSNDPVRGSFFALVTLLLHLELRVLFS